MIKFEYSELTSPDEICTIGQFNKRYFPKTTRETYIASIEDNPEELARFLVQEFLEKIQSQDKEKNNAR